MHISVKYSSRLDLPTLKGHDGYRKCPWWLDPSDPHRENYIREIVLEPTTPGYQGFNPAWGQVEAEQIQQRTVVDVVKNGMKPADAVDKMFKRAEQIFDRYTFA
jgi:multiple sugar transport system substrate-binding protein